MEKEKYFIPEISDLFVGYECEIINYASNNYNKDKSTCKWNKLVLKKEHLFSSYDGSSFLETCVSCLNFGELRVPFLTKEQIESEGWKKTWENIKDIDDNEDCGYKLSSKDNIWHIIFEPNNKNMLIFKNNEGSHYFNGKIKSINEFRTIMKFLEI